MGKRWLVGVAAMLSCLLTQAAAVEQGAPAEAPKPGEVKATAAKPAPDRAAGGEVQKKHAMTKGVSEKLFVDQFGKPVTIREQVFDSKGKVIPSTEIPLREAFLCYPSPDRALADKEVGGCGLPKGYVCQPASAEPHRMLQILRVPCGNGGFQCWLPTSPPCVGCCH